MPAVPVAVAVTDKGGLVLVKRARIHSTVPDATEPLAGKGAPGVPASGVQDPWETARGGRGEADVCGASSAKAAATRDRRARSPAKPSPVGGRIKALSLRVST